MTARGPGASLHDHARILHPRPEDHLSEFRLSVDLSRFRPLSQVLEEHCIDVRGLRDGDRVGGAWDLHITGPWNASGQPGAASSIVFRGYHQGGQASELSEERDR